MADTPNCRSAGSAPDAPDLHEAALNYLARYAATEAALRRVLERRIDRWERRATAELDPEAIAEQAVAARTIARGVAAQLVAAGAVSDVAYAESRARNLMRSGRSQRAILAQLAAKGVRSEAARAAMTQDADSELAALLVLARRRRIGPFRLDDAPDPAQRHRELAILARAGFPQDIARRALAMDPDEAEQWIIALRR